MLYYPPWEALPGHGAAPSADLIGDRLDALQRCLHAEGPVIVATCIQALRQRTISPALLRENSMLLRPGQDLDLQPLMIQLEKSGYEFLPEVQNKSQAALRGGIVDVWPPTSPWPIRIELFGPTIESLRPFNPADQRSLDTLEEFRLAPASETNPDGDLMSFLPPDAAWAFVDTESIRHHAELSDELIRETHAEGVTVPATAVDAASGSAPHVLKFSFAEAPDMVGLDVEPVAGIATGGGSSPLPPHVIEAARAKLIADLQQRIAENWSLHLFFATPGTRERFASTYGQSLAPDHCTLHDGALSEGFACVPSRLLVLTEADIYGIQKTGRGRLDTSIRRGAPQAAALRIADWTELQPGDFVVHVDHGIGKYLGLYEIDFNGQKQEVLSIEYAEKARLHLPVSQTHLLSRYIGLGKRRPNLHALGGKRWTREKEAAVRAVEDLAATLLLQRKPRATHYPATHSPPTRRGSANLRHPFRSAKRPTSYAPSPKRRRTWKRPSPWIA